MEDVAGSCLKQSWGTWDITIITDNCGRTTGTGLFSTKDFISQYVADGDLYTLILSIIDTMPMAKVIVVITVLCMIAFYATSFDSIVYTAACYSYK